MANPKKPGAEKESPDQIPGPKARGEDRKLCSPNGPKGPRERFFGQGTEQSGTWMLDDLI